RPFSVSWYWMATLCGNHTPPEASTRYLSAAGTTVSGCDNDSGAGGGCAWAPAGAGEASEHINASPAAAQELQDPVVIESSAIVLGECSKVPRTHEHFV